MELATGLSSHTSSHAGCGGKVLRGLRGGGGGGGGGSGQRIVADGPDSPSSVRQQQPQQRTIHSNGVTVKHNSRD